MERHSTRHLECDDRGHLNDKIIADEKASFDPDFDHLGIAKGLVGGFSYMFFDISLAQAHAFIQKASSMRSQEDWDELVDAFGIEKESPRFYPFLDWLHDWIGQHLKDAGGLIDIRYYGL